MELVEEKDEGDKESGEHLESQSSSHTEIVEKIQYYCDNAASITKHGWSSCSFGLPLSL